MSTFHPKPNFYIIVFHCAETASGGHGLGLVQLTRYDWRSLEQDGLPLFGRAVGREHNSQAAGVSHNDFREPKRALWLNVGLETRPIPREDPPIEGRKIQISDGTRKKATFCFPHPSPEGRSRAEEPVQLVWRGRLFRRGGAEGSDPLVQRGVSGGGWPSLVPVSGPRQSSAVGSSLVRSGPIRSGLVQSCPVQSGPVRFGLVWSVLVQSSPVLSSPVRFDLVRSSPARSGPVQ